MHLVQKLLLKKKIALISNNPSQIVREYFIDTLLGMRIIVSLHHRLLSRAAVFLHARREILSTWGAAASVVEVKTTKPTTIKQKGKRKFSDSNSKKRGGSLSLVKKKTSFGKNKSKHEGR